MIASSSTKCVDRSELLERLHDKIEGKSHVNDFSLFKFENTHEVRVQRVDGKYLFCGKDICDAIGVLEHRRCLARLDDDEKVVRSAHSLGGAQDTVFVTESGLYSLVLGSRLPTAKPFKRWVTHEVLPVLREYGVYATDPVIAAIQKDPSIIQKMIKDVELQKEDIRKLEFERAELNKKIEQKQYVIDNYDMVNFLDEEKKRADNLAQVATTSMPKYLDVFNCIYIRMLKNKINIPGQGDHWIFKLGESEKISQRLRQHKVEYKGSILLYVNCVLNCTDIQAELKSYLRAQNLLVNMHTDPNGPKHHELFYTLPDLNINQVIGKLHGLCLPCHPISMYEKRISDLEIINTTQAENINKQELVINTLKTQIEQIESIRKEQVIRSEEIMTQKARLDVQIELSNAKLQKYKTLKQAHKDLVVNHESALKQIESLETETKILAETASKTPAPHKPNNKTSSSIGQDGEDAPNRSNDKYSHLKVCVTCNKVFPRESYKKWPNTDNIIHECSECFAKREEYVLDSEEPHKTCIMCGIDKNLKNFNKYKLNTCDICNSWYRLNLAREKAKETHVYRDELQKLLKVGKRRCTKCFKVKNLESSFHKNSRSGTAGYESICSICRARENKLKRELKNENKNKSQIE